MKLRILPMVPFLALGWLANPTQVFAQLTAYEGFAYAASSQLASQAPPPPLGSWSGSATVNATGLEYKNLRVEGLAARSSGGGRAYLDLGGPVNTGIQYISFIASNLGTANLYSTLEFRIGTSADSDNRFVVGVSNDNRSGGGFMAQRPQLNAQPTVFSQSGVPRNDDAHLFVIRLDFTGGPGNHAFSWWLDPDIDAAQPDATLPGFTGDLAFSHIGIAKFGITPGPAIFDEIRLGATWASVIPTKEALFVPATARIQNNRVVLEWQSGPGVLYSVQWSDDLTRWTRLAVGEVNNWQDPDLSTLFPKRFYRVYR